MPDFSAFALDFVLFLRFAKVQLALISAFDYFTNELDASVMNGRHPFADFLRQVPAAQMDISESRLDATMSRHPGDLMNVAARTGQVCQTQVEQGVCSTAEAQIYQRFLRRSSTKSTA